MRATTLPAFGDIRLSCSEIMPDDCMALTRNGKIVWVGKFGSPIEDADFDGMILAPSKYALFRALTGGGDG
ncbi:hypothetical protein [Mesorhizobium hungaricum]|jgi:hypothetical protein|uniref:hypothetical protein n=1 Tax=Mesorhizobium TaxID=68287 RepID=UPI0008241F95|nr:MULTISPECIES: hypothetical protein [Mesorhizobium]MBN9236057.1 hypothetical protein [Mesorhizobium sp.]